MHLKSLHGVMKNTRGLRVAKGQRARLLTAVQLWVTVYICSATLTRKKCYIFGTSLVVQWLRI